MAPDELQRQLDEIEKRVEAIHAAIVGGLDGRPGLTRQIADLDHRVAQLERIAGYWKTVIGGSIAAIVSAYAMLWGGPHAK